MKAYTHKAHAQLFAGRVNGAVLPALAGGWFVLIVDMKGPRTERYTLHGVEADKSFGNMNNRIWNSLVGEGPHPSDAEFNSWLNEGPTSNPDLNRWMNEVLA